MHSMAELLNRAIAWPRRAIGDQPVLTDPARASDFSHISPTLKSEDILTPEELAARLKVPESWVYEKPRTRCRSPIDACAWDDISIRLVRCDKMALSGDRSENVQRGPVVKRNGSWYVRFYRNEIQDGAPVAAGYARSSPATATTTGRKRCLAAGR